METSTITIASLASAIGLFLFRIILKQKGLKLTCSSALFSIKARIGGESSPTASVDDEIEPPRISRQVPL
jgi:hypothetical protein